ncbi:MAG TPA: prolipoprotein diacylglyceryl transferase [Firmicutes bacterium]|nr:prolipoprotein diacylglyceryl transferase [Bacillota bacterium]
MDHYISFPALGWTFNISPTIVEFTLFGHEFSLNWYGLLIALGFLLAVIYALKRAKQFGIDPDRMIDVVLVAAIFAFIGARLYFVLFCDDRAEYLEHPIEILKIWKGGLGIYGGIIFAFIAGLIMCKIRKVNAPAMFDLASLGFLIGQCIGRWGNFFNQEAFGGNTDLPWGMTGDIIQSGLKGGGYTLNEPVHPTFLYESLWCLLGFILLHILSKKAYKFKGQIFSLYLIWYGVGRFMIESLRTDSLYFGAMKVSQLVAVIAVIGGVFLFFALRAHARSLPKDLFAAGTADGTETALAASGEAGGEDAEPEVATSIAVIGGADETEEPQPEAEPADGKEPEDKAASPKEPEGTGGQPAEGSEEPGLEGEPDGKKQADGE